MKLMKAGHRNSSGLCTKAITAKIKKAFQLKVTTKQIRIKQLPAIRKQMKQVKQRAQVRPWRNCQIPIKSVERLILHLDPYSFMCQEYQLTAKQPSRIKRKLRNADQKNYRLYINILMGCLCGREVHGMYEGNLNRYDKYGPIKPPKPPPEPNAHNAAAPAPLGGSIAVQPITQVTQVQQVTRITPLPHAPMPPAYNMRPVVTQQSNMPGVPVHY